MGPGGGSNSHFDISEREDGRKNTRPALPQDPPKWTVGADGDAYRMAVQRWAGYIKRSSPYKESIRLIEATLFDHLVAQLDAASKAVVDTEVIRGTFGESSDPYIKAALLVDFLTQEPAQKTLQRYLDVFEETNRIKRSAYPTMAEYVAEFSGAASKFLRLMGACHGDTIEYLLALTMLTNAQLSPSVLQSAKLSLQRRALDVPTRESLAVRVRTVVSEKVFHMKGLCEQFGDASDDTEAGGSETHSLSATKWLIKKELDSLEKEVGALIPKTSTGPLPLAVSSRFELYLQDAAQTLLSLGTDAPKDGKKVKDGLDHTMEKRISEMSRTLLSVQKQIKKVGVSSTTHDPRTTQRGAKRAQNRGRSRVRGECWDCSSTLHFRGDRACSNPSEKTKQIWVEEDSKEPKNEKVTHH
jgi:hypothetical protein